MTRFAWLLCLIPMQIVSAQGVLPQAGERVRAKTWRGTFRGEFQSIDNSARVVRLLHGDTVLTLPLHSSLRVSVQRGYKPAAVRGAIVGGMVGAIGLGLAASTVAQDCWCDPFSVVLAGAAIGAGGGALIGAMIGAAFKEERWVNVPLSGLRTSWIPRSAEVRLGWEARF